MGVKFTNRNGKEVTLLNPAQKARKYVDELKKGYKITNLGQVKVDENGAVLSLTKEDRQFRHGYLNSRSDGAKAFLSNEKKKKNRKALVLYKGE